MVHCLCGCRTVVAHNSSNAQLAPSWHPVGKTAWSGTEVGSLSSPREHLIQRLLTVVLLLSVFAFSAGAIMYLALRGRTVEVPNVVGKSEEAAAEELEDYGLRLQVKSRAHNDKVPLNVVSDQEPAAGTIVKTGQLVRVGLSLGAPPSNKTTSRSSNR